MNPVALLTLVLSAGTASEGPLPGVRAQTTQLKNYINFRGGAASSSRRPEICVEGGPGSWITLEACGTGSGFLHHDPTPEIGHFRTNIPIYQHRISSFDFRPRVGLGFAEIQIGEDDPGFRFGDVGPRRIETAGPEISGSLETFYPVAAGVEFVGTLNLGLIWAPHASDLATPLPAWLPTVSFTVGIGF
jgi:hypothetical protein